MAIDGGELMLADQVREREGEGRHWLIHLQVGGDDDAVEGSIEEESAEGDDTTNTTEQVSTEVVPAVTAWSILIDYV